MAILIDTQVMIWLESEPNKLSNKTKELLAKEPKVYFSHVSIWEMVIKIKTGKLVINQSLREFIGGFKDDYQFTPLPIALPHIYKTQELEFFHKDPFDRLITQAIYEDIPILSSDNIFDKYIHNRIW